MNASSGVPRPESGAIETEFGVPIPGRILPEDQWARTAIKRLPPPGPLDFSAIFGRTAPVVLDLGCGNGRFTLLSALARPELDHFAIDVLPVVTRKDTIDTFTRYKVYTERELQSRYNILCDLNRNQVSAVA